MLALTVRSSAPRSQTEQALRGEESVSAGAAGRGCQILISPDDSSSSARSPGSQKAGAAKTTKARAPPGARRPSCCAPCNAPWQTIELLENQTKPQSLPTSRLQMLSARRGYPKRRSCLWQPKSAEGSATRQENLLFFHSLPCSQPAANSNWLEAFYRYLSCLYFQVYGRWRETMAASCSPGCSPRRAGGGSASSSKKTNPELILPCLPALLRDPGLLLTHSSCEHSPELLLAGSALSHCHTRGTTGPGSPSQAEIYPFLQFLPQSSTAGLRGPFLYPPPAPGAWQTLLRWLLAPSTSSQGRSRDLGSVDLFSSSLTTAGNQLGPALGFTRSPCHFQVTWPHPGDALARPADHRKKIPLGSCLKPTATANRRP